jgi:hypothetical protein
MDMNVLFLKTSSLIPKRRARLRTTVRAASTDSFITSPNEPVRVITPLPGVSAASMVNKIPTDFGPRQANHLTHLILLLSTTIGVLAHAQVIVQVVSASL